MRLGSSALWEPTGSAQLPGAWPPSRTFPGWRRHPKRSHPVLAGNPRGRGLPRCPVWLHPTPCWEKPGSRVHLEWVPHERGSLSLLGLQEQQLSHQGSHQPRGVGWWGGRRSPNTGWSQRRTVSFTVWLPTRVASPSHHLNSRPRARADNTVTTAPSNWPNERTIQKNDGRLGGEEGQLPPGFGR